MYSYRSAAVARLGLGWPVLLALLAGVAGTASGSAARSPTPPPTASPAARQDSPAGDPEAGAIPVPTEPLREVHYPGRQLYGHIDGGAELYLEFGFRDLVVSSYAEAGVEIEVEAYRMDSPTAAWGIYLANRGRESALPQVQAENTGSAYQIRAVKGDTYLQVNNFSGRWDLLPVMTVLANRWLLTIPAAESPPILARLPATGVRPGSVRLIRGPVALEPIYTLGAGDILQLGGKVFGVVYDLVDPADPGSEASTQIVVPYPDAATARTVFRGLRAGLDPYLVIVRQTDGRFVFRDYQDRYGVARLRGPELMISVRLRGDPGPAGPGDAP